MSSGKKNLQLLANNARFLILPWIKSKNLASKILSLTARHLADDGEKKYNIRPVLLESFVQKNRFAGTCYKAANWRLCGQTKGRGKLGPAGKISVPIKDVWVYPLDKRFRSILKK
ncbi:MAG: Druantia anti-phage system protein DruA [Pseudomonadota bacterium]